MRKFVLAAVMTVFTFGLTLAGEAMFVSYDAATKSLVVKEKKTESTYTVGESTTFTMGDKEIPAEKGMKKLEKMQEQKKGKLDVTGSGGKATAIKFPEGKKKDDK